MTGQTEAFAAISFALLAVYMSVEAVRSLVGGAARPDPSPVGIAVAAVTVVTTAPVARGESDVGHRRCEACP